MPCLRESRRPIRYVERSTSVSSIRSTKVPFILRANAHGYSAERMLPRWMKPVGLGAKRVRTEVVISGYSEDRRRRRANIAEARQRAAAERVHGGRNAVEPCTWHAVATETETVESAKDTFRTQARRGSPARPNGQSAACTPVPRRVSCDALASSTGCAPLYAIPVAVITARRACRALLYDVRALRVP